MLKQLESNQTLRVWITDRNAESLYLCGFPAFVLSNGSSLALFVGGVMTFVNQYNALLGWLGEKMTDNERDL